MIEITTSNSINVKPRCRFDDGRAKLASALSALNFRVDGLEFISSVVDFHLPVDAALSVVDIG